MDTLKTDTNPASADPPAATVAAGSQSIINAMSVDVEEYFQVGAFEHSIERADWDNMQSRAERSMEIVLDLFERSGVRGTFFFLGWIAERYPGLVRKVSELGHEVASHGYDHRRVTGLSPAEFREDIRRTSGILEGISGKKVLGYRAPSFSIGADNLWALDILAEEEYGYSSSIYPIQHDHYGMPSAPRFAYHPVSGADMIEVPVTTTVIAGRNIPCGGGGYFRLLPYMLSRFAIRRVNRDDNQAAVFYCHPWEFDPDQPRQKHAGARSRFRHYTNIGRMERKVGRLMEEFRWGRMDEIFLGPEAPGGS